MKEKTKLYLKRMGIAYALAAAALFFKVCRNNKINSFYTLTPDILINGTYNIYDDNINNVGQISYKKEGEHLLISIKGGEIDGKKEIIDEIYHYDSIEFNNIPMQLKKYENEFYYYYDTGKSVILICLLRPWFTNYSTLEKLSKKLNKSGILKDRHTFMLLNVDYRKYDYALNNLNPTLQNHFTAEGGSGQLYRCFFIQEDEL